MADQNTNNSNNFYYQNVPITKYQSNQDVLDIDFSELYSNFITPIDQIRSHFNALVNGSGAASNISSGSSSNSGTASTSAVQQLYTPQYQESRLHAFYRMMGFPIVAGDNSFYSPGFDPNLNTDNDSLTAYQKIAVNVANNLSITNQFLNREQIPVSYNRTFLASGINAQALALGSIFIRQFDTQLGNTDPLVADPNATQNINERVSEVQKIFGSSITSNFLKSNHPLKPFIVDPRVDNSIRPIVNRICAPFLVDRSQTKIFQSQSTSGSNNVLKRPYIERVISTRFNNSNITNTNNVGQDVINDVVSNFLNNKNISDQDLNKFSSNPLAQFNSEITYFNNYIKIIQIIIENLADAVREIQRIRQNINWQPIPDKTTGVEVGGSLNPVDPTDQNNKMPENQIILYTQKKIISDLSFDNGLQGVPDSGDFAFSNLDDSVFSIDKNITKSYQENIDKITNVRNQLGNQAITYMNNIEIIMGEFSGIGLIDIVAMQTALWIMEPSALLGLIDQRAFQRAKKYRPDLNLNNINQADITTALQNFETTLKQIYLYIQTYYNGIINGTIHTY